MSWLPVTKQVQQLTSQTYVIDVFSYVGVHSVVVALLAEKADIQYNPEQTDPDKLVREVQSLGFGADLIEDHDGYQQGTLNLVVSVN